MLKPSVCGVETRETVGKQIQTRGEAFFPLRSCLVKEGAVLLFHFVSIIGPVIARALYAAARDSTASTVSR